MLESFKIERSIREDICKKLSEASYANQFEVFNNILIYYYNMIEELDIDEAMENSNEEKVMDMLILRRIINDTLEELKIEFGYNAMHKTLKYRPKISIKPPRS